ncbi:MAG TPA: MFS transporter [Candidatus Kapabacteria bacterium]|nr:MFS transporter [Candidatus Kapabacteria bacterium]
MTRSRLNHYVYILEALNALSTAFYFNYLFFFLKSEYAFSNSQNLLVCALNGAVFVPCALLGGKYGQKHGYVNAFALGSVIMALSLAVSALLSGVPALMIGMCVWTFGMCFTWPNLEALVCDHVDPARLPGIIGVYNVVWAAGGALAYFWGGAIAEALGWRSIFWLPAIVSVVQLGIAIWLNPRWKEICARPVEVTGDIHENNPEGPLFLRMAWIANPFAYIAINAVLPVFPMVAAKFGLSPKFAGFFCSVWFFSRMVTFAVLALWPGWHYRFRYLIMAYVGMVFCFAGVLLINNLWMVIAVQIAFGWCLGLIYYSSLYYSMHVGDTKGEHGGAHEAAIGAGIFGGPAIGATSIALFPDNPGSSVVGVSIVLAIGFTILLFIRRKRTNATAMVPNIPNAT